MDDKPVIEGQCNYAYDPEAEAWYFYVIPRHSESIPLTKECQAYVDLNAAGEVVGIEILT